MRETDLYNPVKTLLENQGYEVKGEVGAVDIFAMKDDCVVAVELKTSISLKLIYQVVERQKIADWVYIAVPQSAVHAHRLNMKNLRFLLKRLSVGLIVVKENTVAVLMDAEADALGKHTHKEHNRKKRLVSEFNHRENNLNIGGIRGKKLTFYKEKVIAIALILKAEPGLSPKLIKEKTAIDDASQILQKNYYQWFERIRRGCYQLSELGEKELALWIK